LHVHDTQGDWEITWSEYESITRDLRQQFAQRIGRVVAEHKTTVGETLLVGGASQMRCIEEIVRELLGRAPSHLVNPNELIARGAAHHSYRYLLATQGQMMPQTQTPVYCTKTLQLREMLENGTPGETLLNLPFGTKLPVSLTEQVVTRNGARSITLALMTEDGPGPTSPPRLLSKAKIEDIPPDALEDWPLDISLQMGITGRIAFEAQVRYTPCKAQVVLQRPDCVSTSRVRRWRSVVEAQGGLASYLALARQEEAAASHTPVAVNQSTATAIPTTPETQADGVIPFLQRMMPLFFRQVRRGIRGVEAPETPAPTPPPRTPPSLEVVGLPPTRPE
jgi:hypothetical protein